MVANTGLQDSFSRIISVDEVKVYKPNPRVYQLAAATLDLAPEAVGFVSSNAWDICGAKAYGFWTCWLNRRGAPWEELGLSFDAELSRLTGLLDLLAQAFRITLHLGLGLTLPTASPRTSRSGGRCP